MCRVMGHIPDAGQIPYVSLTGNIQMAGHSQSPAGSFAVTSMRPYLIENDFLVLRRADLTGLMMLPFVVFVTATQSDQVLEVQPLLRRFRVLLLMRSASSCKVG